MQKMFAAALLLAFAFGCVQQPQFGAYGSAHEHADFKMYVNVQAIDFSAEKYQTEIPHDAQAEEECGNDTSRLVHMHGWDGNVVHKHATGVTWGYFFGTIGINMSDSCIFVRKDGTALCDAKFGSWRYFVNGKEVKQIRNVEIMNLDRVLITYGQADKTEIAAQLETVTSKAASEDANGTCASGEANASAAEGYFDS